MKKMLFIYNPNAGTGVLKPKLSDVLDIFVKAGYEVTVYPTQCYHDAMAKAESYTESYDVVVCSKLLVNLLFARKLLFHIAVFIL